MGTLQELSGFLMQTAVYSILPAFALSIYRLPASNRVQRLLAWFIIFSTICEFGAMYIAKELHQPNLWVAHLVTLVRFPVFTWLYKNYYPKSFLVIITICFTIFALFDSLILENPLEQFNAIGRSVEAILLLVLALGFLYKTLRDLQVKRIESMPLFWASVSIIIFFSGSFFIYMFNNINLDYLINNEVFGGVYSIFLIVHYFLFAIALGLNPSKK